MKKPIIPTDRYRDVRDSHLVGLSGYTREGLPVFAFGVGLSTFDKASDNYYVQSHIQINEYRDRVVLPAASKKHGKHISKCIKIFDMTGLKLSALSQIKLCTIISSIDDLSYPEKTVTYYIVNAPYIFSACWKVCPYSKFLSGMQQKLLYQCCKISYFGVMFVAKAMYDLALSSAYKDGGHI